LKKTSGNPANLVTLAALPNPHFVVETALHQPGLPDGLFSNQKSKFGCILEGFGMENVVIFYDHFEYITAISYILLQFGIV
jgi:hypothetical protein